jgi:hypothetical protein
MAETIDKSHNVMALIMITGIIFSTIGFFLANVSGLKSEKKKVAPENKKVITIVSSSNEK